MSTRLSVGLAGFILLLFTLAASGCIVMCDEYACDGGQAAVTLRPAKASGALALGSYTWTVETSEGEVFAGQCEIAGTDSECDGGALLSFRDGEVVGWQLTINDAVSADDPQPASAQIELVHGGQVLFTADQALDYEPRDDCHLDCLDAVVAIEQ